MKKRAQKTPGGPASAPESGKTRGTPPGDSEGTDPVTEDLDLFAREMRGVKPLPQARQRLPVPPATPPGRSRGPAGAPVVTPLRAVDGDGAPAGWGYLAHDASRELLRELRSGGRPVDASLDLHGLTAAECAPALERFLREADRRGQRVLLVIHGRGRGSGPAGPVLAELVRERLSSGPPAARVLALCRAPAKLGGEGAALILLRKTTGSHAP